jgi:hypothetical protein
VGHDAEARRPVPEPAAPARPAAAGTASMSGASLLAIQRSAGNQAVVAMLGGSSSAGANVVRRAWVEGAKADTWDATIDGLDWERREGDGFEYRYYFADSASDEVRDRFAGQAAEWHPASWWRNTWAERAAWPDVLEPAAAAAPIVAPPADVAEHDDGGDDAADAPAEPVVVDAAAATAQLGHPTVASVRAVQYAPGGRFSWPVTMTASVAAQASRTWIIQQVDATLDGTARPRYWEAFLVPAGRTVASDQDIYQDPEEYDTAGTSTVRGVMQHHAFDGNGAPPGFVLGAGDADGEQLATTAQPAFWGAGGTAHDITVVWNDKDGAAPTITTVPATGAATRVASHADFT